MPGNINPMIEQKILEKTSEAILFLYNQTVDPMSIGLEKTKKEIKGDFTLITFPLSKISHKSPDITAVEIGNFLKQGLPQLKDFYVIKGFLNLTLRDDFWVDFVNTSAYQTCFGFHEQNNNKPVVLEYSSPNTNKPLHLGHIRNNLLGYSLAEILRANGNRVIKVNLVNDRGIHICKSMLAYKLWGRGETPESADMKGDHLVGKYYVLFNRNYRDEVMGLVGKGFTEDEAMRQAPLILEAQELLRKWEARDDETVGLWKKMNSWTYTGFDRTYQRLGVDFDHTYYESETYLLGKELVAEGLERGFLTRKEDGSVWADLRDQGLDEKLLIRSDGTSVYMTQDLGTAQRRIDEFHPSKMIYVVGNEQNYHFDVLKKILDKLHKNYAEDIYHLSYGMVELPHGRMKSREGEVIDADDLMDEMFKTAEVTTRELGKATGFSEPEAETLFNLVGLGALKYFILKVDPKKNMLFNPKESIDFNGNTGPFIQYTHARIQSLLRKAVELGHSLSDIRIPESVTILEQEKTIIRMLYQFPMVVKQAGEELNPAVIANYVYDLAKEYNQFYQENPVLKEEIRDLVDLRLKLSSFTGKIIKRAMGLLGIEVPERM